MSGQSITDRITAAQHSVTGSAVSKIVCKATTHEIMGPKKKHLDFLRVSGSNPDRDLIQCTNEMNVNIPHLADTFFERTTNGSWVVVFKALIATHHLMVYGNERFIQYLASRNTLFNLSNFLDKSGLQEKYFDMKKIQCKEGLDIYKKFLTRMTRISEFLKVAEQVGIDKGDIPDLSQGQHSLKCCLITCKYRHIFHQSGRKGKTSGPGGRAGTLKSTEDPFTSTDAVDDSIPNLNPFLTQPVVEASVVSSDAVSFPSRTPSHEMFGGFTQSPAPQPQTSAGLNVDFDSVFGNKSSFTNNLDAGGK
ncbi:UNVERIFIED_CONTAM: hypothetical protein FKN15_018863 [Acipenser sinensis]